MFGPATLGEGASISPSSEAQGGDAVGGTFQTTFSSGRLVDGDSAPWIAGAAVVVAFLWFQSQLRRRSR